MSMEQERQELQQQLAQQGDAHRELQEVHQELQRVYNELQQAHRELQETSTREQLRLQRQVSQILV